MKILLGQINTTPGDFKGNCLQIYNGIDMAGNKNADMVVFPELSIPGYLSCDKMFHKNYVKANLKCLHEIIDYSKTYPGLYIVVGYIGKNNTGVGKPFANLLAVINNGTLVDTYQKQLLPFYDVFDEGRYYEPGNNPLVIDIKGQRVGFAICEDVWNDKGQDDYRYKNNPVQIYRDELDVDMIITINSSPYAQGKPEQRMKMLGRICGKNKTLVYVNQQGGQDELVFDGRSCVIKDKTVYAEIVNPWRGPWEDAQYLLVDTNKPYGYTCGNYQYDLYDMIIMGLRDYIKKCGFKEVVVGSSGGIDSAVVLALASAAIGPKNVTAIMMPSKWSSEGSVADAKKLHAALGCKEYVVHIEHVELLEKINENLSLVKDKYNPVADQNIQARLRGMIVMHYSNATGALPLTTGNKTECAVGYCTLYGDTNGGFNPLKDLYKMQVYAMAKYINNLHKKEVIPNIIIQKAPSAELEPDQTDEENLLPYPILDLIVKLYIEEYIGTWMEFKECIQTNYPWGQMESEFNNHINNWIQNNENKQDYDRIINLINSAEFKRRQSAPGIKLSKVAFGTGRRLPIVAKYME